MSDTEILVVLARKHKDWIAMVISMGCSVDIAEDIVQDMYIKMHRLHITKDKIEYKQKDINTFYVYVTLRNLYYDVVKDASKMSFVPLEEIAETENAIDNDDSYARNAFEGFMKSVNTEMASWHDYDRLLMEIYITTDFSLRDISRGTGISLGSIYNSIQNGKERIQNNCTEEYEAWKKAQSGKDTPW